MKPVAEEEKLIRVMKELVATYEDLAQKTTSAGSWRRSPGALITAKAIIHNKEA
jgi:hypothetical protein